MIMQNLKDTMGIMVYTGTMLIVIMLKNIYTQAMITQKMKTKLITVMTIFLLGSCSLAPGMHMVTESSFGNNKNFVTLEDTGQKIFIEDLVDNTDEVLNVPYKIGNGDQIAITVWGLNEVFPIVNVSPDQNLRRVDSNGNIFFPFVGMVKATGLTQDQLREKITNDLSNFFNDPQLDLSIARFNPQKVYLLGEVTRPSKLNITDIPLSLADALGEVQGISTNTASGSNVFVIRQGLDGQNERIFKADLSSPSSFILAGNFYLQNNDIIYVNAKATTRWNRVISQFFPFSTFLNSIDNLTDGN